MMRCPYSSSLLILPLVVFGSLCLPGCGDAGPDLTKVSVPADFAEDGAIMKLIAAREAVVAADPKSPSAHLSLGLALLVNGGPELAAESFRNTLALDATDPEARYQLAKLRGAAGDTEGEIAGLREVLRTQPGFFAAHYALGCTLLDDGQLEAARESFEQVKEAGDSSTLGDMGIGLVELEAGNPKLAIAHLLAALKQYPKENFIRFKLEQAYRAVGRDNMAEQVSETYDGAVGRPTARSTGDIQAGDYMVGMVEQGTRASNLLAEKRYAEARVVLEKLYLADPKDPTTINNLAVAYIHTGNVDGALKTLEAGIADDPTQYAMYSNLALGLRRQSERESIDQQQREELLDRALETIDEGIRQSASFGTSHLQRGRVLKAMGRHGKSLEAYQEAIRLGETAEAVYLEMVPPAAERGGVTLVETILREGISKGAIRMELRFALCKALLESGQGDRARQEQRAMRAVSPKHPLGNEAHQVLKAQGH